MMGNQRAQNHHHHHQYLLFINVLGHVIQLSIVCSSILSEDLACFAGMSFTAKRTVSSRIGTRYPHYQKKNNNNDEDLKEDREQRKEKRAKSLSRSISVLVVYLHHWCQA